jgi:predicted Rossmann fold nucleotide-binding protein DprA/Smf involved in DNA uptake
VDLDTLTARTGMAAGAVLAELTELEIAGTVCPVAGGRWQRRRGAPNFVAPGS